MLLAPGARSMIVNRGVEVVIFRKLTTAYATHARGVPVCLMYLRSAVQEIAGTVDAGVGRRW